MIEPVSEHLTMLTSPAWRANGRDDDLRCVPQRGVEQAPDGRPQELGRAPRWRRPSGPASGTIASAEVRNTSKGLGANRSSPTPIGMKISSQFRLIGLAPAPSRFPGKSPPVSGGAWIGSSTVEPKRRWPSKLAAKSDRSGC